MRTANITEKQQFRQIDFAMDCCLIFKGYLQAEKKNCRTARTPCSSSGYYSGILC